MRVDLPCGRMIGTAVCDRISFGKYIRLYPIIICTPDFQHISVCAHPLKQRKPRSPVPSGTAGPFREIVARFWVMSYILTKSYIFTSPVIYFGIPNLFGDYLPLSASCRPARSETGLSGSVCKVVYSRHRLMKKSCSLRESSSFHKRISLYRSSFSFSSPRVPYTVSVIASPRRSSTMTVAPSGLKPPPTTCGKLLPALCAG